MVAEREHSFGLCVIRVWRILQASLAQKYIESFGARGLVMLNPCAPDCASSIEASVPKSAGLSGDAFATAIRAGFGADSPESFVKRWMLSEGVSDTTLQSALASLRTGGINTSVSPFDCVVDESPLLPHIALASLEPLPRNCILWHMLRHVCRSF